MAQFTGFTCDACEMIVKSEERVRKTTRFESDDPYRSGEAKQDLCPECAGRHMADPGIGEIQPLRRRKKAEEAPEPPESRNAGEEPEEGSYEGDSAVPLPS